MNYLKQRIGKIIAELDKRTVIERIKINDISLAVCDYKGSCNTPPENAEWVPFNWGGTFGGSFEWHGWFKAKISIPERLMGANVELYNWVTRQSPQIITYIDGKTVQGGDPNHRCFPIDTSKSEYELLSYIYVGYNSDSSEYIPELRIIDEQTKKLYWDIRVPYDVMCFLPEDSIDFCNIRTALNEAINLIDLRESRTEEYYRSIKAATEYLQKNFYGKLCGKQPSNVVCVGHTHIDVAWLWPFRQTREKAQRSFSTVVNMMKEFPEYKFMSSQPQLYEYVKEDDPELYSEIKKLVKEGRWEVEGAMWLEADCNLINGESMIRQILIGKQFMRREFGKESEILWLPDVFGYSAAMPQILRKSGVNKFFTSKISWNETNRIPYDVFMWEGIDGSEIFSYFLTTHDLGSKETRSYYTGDTRPRQVMGTWENFQQKDIANEVMLLYGHGDGGGGPTREMLETGRRLEKGIPGCPSTTFEFATDYLNRLEKQVAKNRFLPKWVGELYLELHRGTYTSIARNKKKNRQSEFLMQATELFNSINRVTLGEEYPTSSIRKIWKDILLCQFHDVLPGSSIEEVYRDTDVIYERVFEEGNRLLDGALSKLVPEISSNGGVLVFNSNGFQNSSAVEYNGSYYWAENIPAMGWGVVSELSECCNVKADIEKRIIENKFIRVTFDSNFEIKSIWDKKVKRELVKKGERANALQAFEDIPKKWDAWEITNYYEEKMWSVNELDTVEPYRNGIFAGFAVTRHFQKSVIRQIIRMSDFDSKIDFVTEVDWKNNHILLKAAFPTTIHSDRATYEIQYGNVERPTHYNTSWDQARFEVCGHKWADISEYGYGVSMMNDSKYGYDIHAGTMRLSLIKSATDPNPAADKEHHTFIYSLYPHEGDYREANTVQKAYALNNPMRAAAIDSQVGKLPSEFSLVTTDSENIIVEAVKFSEDGEGIIVRLYDSYHMRSEVTVHFGFTVSEASLCDMMENRERTLKVKDDSVKLAVAPFEIITLKLKF